MQNKDKIFITNILIIFTAIISFTFPFIVSKIQDKKIESNIITISVDKLNLESNILISDTIDMSLIYDIITNGEKKVVDFNYYDEAFPSQLIDGVNDELNLLEEYGLISNASFDLIDTPVLLMYSTNNGFNLLVWEYYFVDVNDNIMKLLYHSKTNRILLLEYQTDNPDKYADVIISYFGTIGYDFDYIPDVMLEVIGDRKIIKTMITLKETYYDINIYAR